MSFFAPRVAVNKANKTASEKKAEIKASQPWVEKYRPKSMDDISSQEQAVAVLKKALQSDNLPHLLFYGPPGTGKTSTILALAHELYGPKLVKSRVLELNASDERGIQIVRDKVKDFSRTTVTGKVDGYPCPPFKIVILDEADSMTNDAQSALRRTMETYSKTTRFCLICNYVSRIIEPITSRCAKFRFKSLPVNDLEQRLQMIADKEKVYLAPKALQTIIDCSGGDLRKAITLLQSGYNLATADKSKSDTEMITPRMVEELAGMIPNDAIQHLMDLCITNVSNTTVKDIQKAIQDMMNEGYAGENILLQTHAAFIHNNQLDTLQKSRIAQFMATVDIDLIQGADEQLQLLNLMCQMANIAATAS
ncbi:P-loop containing nucleoside triphosphate hydrolase protein [Mycotypha africana]|uniref:P-loop containing nucleoside triphosphate hydrolase protein n=1 Tax=Mycotypha africana TaxID=64632 RepID=UPI0023009F6A|nr:P-loop containing nucleoside triphosphate hydrolase protein [Mycotypha africana]KAI8987407.1 P-loop containing nucleoside triphosphate hydrolase protein [Mycotypha africana]